ncbi:LuxR C-terminal-related transcriptional regulator [Nocardia halotolerans]|uniref:LuxR C-terminal-related transcriptional regulator n=1 Tax=Nocardia halotolerans TaxID=1755878 RepID=A0ABV8VGP7_9NOCA
MAPSSGSLDFHSESPAIAGGGHGVDTGIPELSFAPVPCARLYSRFDRAAAGAGHTVLVCGPAGSGKTVALVDWLHKRRRKDAPHIAWLTVTEHLAEDNALLCAIARAFGAAPDLVGDTGLRTPIDRATDLVDLLAEADPAVLVIDDAHLLTDPLQLAGLEYLLARLPAQLTVLVAGRFEPPLRWHTLELAGRLARVGAGELELSPRRVAQLLAQHGCHLATDELTVVHTLTRGWAALVRIAAIYLDAHADDRGTALAALARPTHAVADFLVAELIESLSPRTLEFLLATAVPAHFCLPMAAELVGADAPRLLDELLRANFPLHTSAHGGELWHTYHPMLRAYLLAEAAHSRPERQPALHRRIANWFTAEGLPGQALEHVVAEPGAPALAQFLREWGIRMVLDGSGHALLAAIEHVPGLTEDTFVRLLRAAVAVESGEIAAAEVYLESAHVGSWPTSTLVPTEWVTALDHAVSAGVAVLVGDSASLPWPLPEVTGQPDLDCYAGVHCGSAEVFGGRVTSGAAALRHAVVYAEEAGLGRVAVRARTALAVAAGIAGRIGELRALAAESIDCADRYELTDSTEAALARVTAAYGAFQQGLELERPLPELPGDTADETIIPAPLRQARIVLGLLTAEAATDRTAVAGALSKQLHRLLDESPALLGTGALVTEVLWQLLRRQARTEAQHLVEHARRVLGATPDMVLAEAGLAVYTHRPAIVSTLLTPVLTATLPSRSLVTAWLLIGVAAELLDRPRKVDDAVEQALAHADDEQLVRPFLDVPGAAELLDRLGGRFGRFDAFVDHVRAHRGTAAGAPRLTDTELLVLRQLPSGLTATSIAADLGVSVNTVKTHLRGIYQKLGVNARGAAIARARELGLL